MNDQISDPKLRLLVEHLMAFANIEIPIRAALIEEGSGARRRQDEHVRKALRGLDGLNAPDVKGITASLRKALLGIRRSHSLGEALELARGLRRATRVAVDARAAELGVVVPPLHLLTEASSEVLAEMNRQLEQIASTGGVDAFDAGLSSHDDGDEP